MAITATLTTGLALNDTTQATQIVRGTLTFSGSYVLGGDLMPLNLYGVQSNYIPVRVLVYDYPAVGGTPTGYEFVYLSGTDPSNGRLYILQSGIAFSAPNAQVPANTYATLGNIAAASAAGAIQFEAVFQLGN